ncbi:hypothetical protein EDB80DRAFT_734440 [Ilyonectria destructans]|nr:hypothetical protein EDB80DRAFT_734440 [Ilyonectria destructans]
MPSRSKTCLALLRVSIGRYSEPEFLGSHKYLSQQTLADKSWSLVYPQNIISNWQFSHSNLHNSADSGRPLSILHTIFLHCFFRDFTMSQELIRDFTPAEGVRVLAFNRPTKRNALSGELFSVFLDRLSLAAADKAVRAIIVTGSNMFVFGSPDIKEIAALDAEAARG